MKLRLSALIEIFRPRPRKEGRMSIETLGVVRLRVPSGEWEAGTEGTVVEVLEDTALVEIADEEGRMRDLLSVPLDAVTPVAPQAQVRLPV
jgi:hypothetical protein